jgi:hypothetical protein
MEDRGVVVPARSGSRVVVARGALGACGGAGRAPRGEHQRDGVCRPRARARTRRRTRDARSASRSRRSRRPWRRLPLQRPPRSTDESSTWRAAA